MDGDYKSDFPRVKQKLHALGKTLTAGSAITFAYLIK